MQSAITNTPTGKRKMRQEFIQTGTAKQAWAIAHWATVIFEVKGGYQAFESVIDYDVWVINVIAAQPIDTLSDWSDD